MDRENAVAAELMFGDVGLMTARQEIVCGESKVRVKGTAFRLLLLLITNANDVVSRQRIFASVWGCNFDPGTKRLEVQLHYLRNVLRALDCSIRIRTYRGKGLRVYALR
ncbi:TPA: winged helix-turn-helix transcriptional regulator [Pseudomonas aeruginosa]|uniref:Winged helix family transcriptional regulator n=1 Tax=Pseudomonas monteilii TaxID=76759 RepID=A0A399M4W3_9PSED|nr:winged helix-turn-helix transcriptional regulator [Pseudomonas aeruginosa]RII76822.1 winged helix family transcriptional regulator [Pseudomonas monteilii]EKW1536052.1 winged helix-turn-helix transcriptional regulator [Pseudomonas aeruginosa]ELQ7978672.1 winged helix-turn-helix transcriptional regulator [Pseudomonas aeruginosa]ELV3002800.1 winged helix-turn-helix transcriptional regulator [Pseudomonas aeruginosa]